MQTIETTNNYLLENSTANVTTTLLYGESEEQKQILDLFKSGLIIFLIVFGLITVTGLVGNILTVAVIVRKKGVKSISDTLILNLALTDIIFIVFCVPMRILAFVISTLPFGDVWCRLIDYVTYACDYA
ncbi:hypothetical protein ACJMK2_043479, partial [Sinanodonta woodiana]